MKGVVGEPGGKIYSMTYYTKDELLFDRRVVVWSAKKNWNISTIDPNLMIIQYLNEPMYVFSTTMYQKQVLITTT